MSNTKVSYLYRDASNYKRRIPIVLNGEITKEQISTVIASLEDGEYFIPEQIMLPMRRPMDTINEDDHCYCELHEDDFSVTDEDVSTVSDYDELPVNGIAVEDFVERFAAVGRTGWDSVTYAVEI